MINLVTFDLQNLIEQYKLLLAGEQYGLPDYLLQLRTFEIIKKPAAIRLRDYSSLLFNRKLPGYLYNYIPDQRPITQRLIGKPSAGPSPPGKYHLSR